MYDNELYHYGVSIDDGAPGRGSGRYPKGSGDNPYQHSSDLLTRIERMRLDGMSDIQIAEALKLYNTHGEPSTSRLKSQISVAKNQMRLHDIEIAKQLYSEGKGATEIGRIMGKNESTIRGYLNAESENRSRLASATADELRSRINSVGMVDVGAGAERYLNVSRTRFDAALEQLQIEGYELYAGRVPQVTNPNKFTTMKIICPPGTEHKEIYNFENINSVRDFDVISHDGGDSFKPKWVYPASLDPDRLKIRYAEDGGINKDGVIELKRGVEDISLGESHYSQVRILVGEDRYLKGMAVYGDDKDFPPGVDVIFNTNKTKDVPKMEVLKPTSKNLKNDPNNPFGALLREKDGQSYYIDENGEEKLRVINKTRREGDWNDWSKELPSQFLAKQPDELYKKQLKISIDNKKAEFDTIMELSNPTVKKVMLESFALDCDTTAEELKAASLPRQRYQVILPVTSLKDSEIYAPNYHDGEKVALVRFPHGGTFEIPILTVNNRNAEGKKVITKNASDAVGINSKVAERLSGADFDGDTVLVIPTHNGNVKVNSTNPLKGLEGFDPKVAYPKREGMTFMKYTDSNGKTIDNTQKQMGMISNLITDMTIGAAKDEELARAVRHSMVVIDAAKHDLDYKRSEQENGIAELKRIYQGHRTEDGRYSEGANTLISRAKSEVTVDRRQGEPRINKNTGELEYKTADNLYYTDKNGKVKKRTQQSTQMAETKDARTLSTGTMVEEAYADYANTMKSLANQARKTMVNTKSIEYSPKAKEIYKDEVDSLNKKLNDSLKNAPKERMAQYIANSKVNAIKADNPDISKKELKKIKQKQLVEARSIVGAERVNVDITDKEWEAIQSGAISESTLRKICDHTDMDKLKELAMPRSNKSLSNSQINRIKSLSLQDYSNDDIATMLGISATTVNKYLKGGN